MPNKAWQGLKGFKKSFTQGKFTMAYISQRFYPKKNTEMQQKFYLQQNTLCWMQQTNLSPENFTAGI